MTEEILFLVRWQPNPACRLVVLLLIVAVLLQGETIHGSRVYPRYCDGPQHVRIAVGPDPSREMIVSFGSIPSFVSSPIGGVLVGESPLSMKILHMEPEPASHYRIPVDSKKSNGRSSESMYYSLYYHHVTISGLEPNTTYFYQPIFHESASGFPKNVEVKWNAGSESAVRNRMSNNEPDEDYTRRRNLGLEAYEGKRSNCPSEQKIRSFRTAPVPSKDTSVSFAIMGDLGMASWSVRFKSVSHFLPIPNRTVSTQSSISISNDEITKHH